MATKIFFRVILNCSVPKLKTPLPVVYKKLHTEIPIKEIQIPTRYGHIAGKLWGTGDQRPLLALHGWQDNAGTWDPLIPMIIKDRPILAIDFPGHGMSSWIPAGSQYFQWELPRIIKFLQEHFKWDKVSILSHSMGAIASMRFACIFPDDVDMYIAVDSLIYDDYDLDLVLSRYNRNIVKGLTAMQRLDKEPPAYTEEEITKKWHLGTGKSVALDSVKYLLARGIKASSADPNKYYYSRDSRLKYILFTPEDRKFVEALVRRLKAPTLYIKAINSPYSADPFSVEMRELIEKVNDKYEFHFVPGTHHVHLNNPELLAPLIKNFMQKHNLSL